MLDKKLMGFVLLTIMVLLTVAGQMLFKWQVDSMPGLPEDLWGRTEAVARFLLRPWVILAFALAFLASLTWIGVLGQFELSYAYPFTSFSFALVLVLSAAFFGESITLTKVLGIALIAVGVFVASR